MDGLVKHYQNDMKGIPQLTNNWGSMINLLDAVLVTGFNIVPVLSLSKAASTSITATINLGSGHGFIDRQVVRIAGSTNGWNGDYKVLSADGASITIECTAEHAGTILGTATCFTAPLDFEIVYQTPAQSTTPKRAYRSTDPESLGLILLVHDFCVSGASATGAKFAKVGVVSSMSDINTITGTQMPFDALAPNANWSWDGAYHGWAKWYYARTSVDNASDANAPGAGSRGFYLSGDSTGFAITVNNSTAWASYVFSELYDALLGAKNLVFSASGLIGKRSQSQILSKFHFNTVRTGQTYGQEHAADGGYRTDWAFWLNSDGLPSYTMGGYLLTLNMIYLNTSGYAIWTNSSHYNLKNNYYFPMILNDIEGYFRGQMPFLRINAMQGSNGMVIDMDQGKFFSYRVGDDSKMSLTTHALEQK